eukprot:1347888-Amorphochlora_amoeboformis.AAC.2
MTIRGVDEKGGCHTRGWTIVTRDCHKLHIIVTLTCHPLNNELCVTFWNGHARYPPTFKNARTTPRSFPARAANLYRRIVPQNPEIRFNTAAPADLVPRFLISWWWVRFPRSPYQLATMMSTVAFSFSKRAVRVQILSPTCDCFATMRSMVAFSFSKRAVGVQVPVVAFEVITF